MKYFWGLFTVLLLMLITCLAPVTAKSIGINNSRNVENMAARVVGVDPMTDLAVLKIESPGPERFTQHLGRHIATMFCRMVGLPDPLA